jgi:hypothetical protein
MEHIPITDFILSLGKSRELHGLGRSPQITDTDQLGYESGSEFPDPDIRTSWIHGSSGALNYIIFTIILLVSSGPVFFLL